MSLTRLSLGLSDERPHAAASQDGNEPAPDSLSVEVASLQLERAELDASGDRTPCAICTEQLRDRYFEVNGGAICLQCRDKLRAQLEAGSPLSRAVRATAAGLLAAFAGTILYFVILKATGAEFGLIAILVGVMVGKAVSWGAYGRGGWRYQTLAMLLTYIAIVTSYIPVMMTELSKSKASQASAKTSTLVGAQTSAQRTPDTSPPATFLGVIAALFVLIMFACAVPFLAGISNIMGIVIIGIGVYEAWKFNRRRQIVITGPHALGPSVAPSAV